MYSRSYTEDSVQESAIFSGVKIPPGYDGNAVFDTREATVRQTENYKSEDISEPTFSATHKKDPHRSIFGELFSKLPFYRDGGFGGFLSHIGTEEILLIGLALFLLFSEEGDKECAIMLILLLFIGG